MTHSDFIQMNLFSGDQDTEGIRLSCVLDIPLPCDEDPRSPITVTWNLYASMLRRELPRVYHQPTASSRSGRLLHLP